MSQHQPGRGKSSLIPQRSYPDRSQSYIQFYTALVSAPRTHDSNRKCANIKSVEASRLTTLGFYLDLDCLSYIKTMSSKMMSKIPTIDLAPFTVPSAYSNADRLLAGKAFATALHRYGFAKVAGHGLPKDEVDEAFAWNKKLFDLPHTEKIKAPHPPGPFPHRGYSGKVPEGELKESYEVGSEEDDQQQNIWLPDDTLPGFRAYALSLYERLAGVGFVLLHAMGVGLGFNGNEQDALEHLASKRHSQLRFMHYPAVSKARLQSEEEVSRLAAHNDWGYIWLPLCSVCFGSKENCLTL